MQICPIVQEMAGECLKSYKTELRSRTMTDQEFDKELTALMAGENSPKKKKGGLRRKLHF